VKNKCATKSLEENPEAGTVLGKPDGRRAPGVFLAASVEPVSTVRAEVVPEAQRGRSGSEPSANNRLAMTNG